jgi:hypothetical protein
MEDEMESQLTVQQMLGNLVKVAHHDYEMYKADGISLVNKDPDLFAHLIAWNHKKGEVRSSKIALATLGLKGEPGHNSEYYENAIAHILTWDPINLMHAVDFYQKTGPHKNHASSILRDAVEKYVRVREAKKNWWDSVAVQHRKALKNIYKCFKIKPSKRAQQVLFDRDYPANSVFSAIKDLKGMAPKEAAGTIMNYKIPFNIAVGAVGGLKGNTDLTLAIIESMSPSELVTNTKLLTKVGVMDNPVLKLAYDKGLKKTASDKKVSTLKMDRAKDFIKDTKAKAKLEKVQEERLDNLEGPEGDWLILGDMSGSMDASVEKAKEIAAFLARVCKGKVYLVFFNTMPKMYDVSGKTFEEIKELTRGIRATGGTSVGCGLKLIQEKSIVVNGIIMITDGGDNTPPLFPNVYNSYIKQFDFEPNVYMLHLPGESDKVSYKMENMGYPYTKLEMTEIDRYGLPNLLKILKTKRYTLMDEIMETPLLTINGVLGV